MQETLSGTTSVSGKWLYNYKLCLTELEQPGNRGLPSGFYNVVIVVI